MRVKFPERILGAGRESPPRDGEVIELALLLPSGQVTALERAARCRGLTLGQIVRRLIRDFLAQPTATVPGARGQPSPESRIGYPRTRLRDPPQPQNHIPG